MVDEKRKTTVPIPPVGADGEQPILNNTTGIITGDEGEINLETSFKDDLGADSLDLFELVMALEDEYSVEIPAEELQELTTVGSVIDYLKNKGVEA